jgi:hypothetical protein
VTQASAHWNSGQQKCPNKPSGKGSASIDPACMPCMCASLSPLLLTKTKIRPLLFPLLPSFPLPPAAWWKRKHKRRSEERSRFEEDLDLPKLRRHYIHGPRQKVPQRASSSRPPIALPYGPVTTQYRPQTSLHAVQYTRMSCLCDPLLQ